MSVCLWPYLCIMPSARVVILSLVACVALPYFSTLSHKRQDFEVTFTYLLTYSSALRPSDRLCLRNYESPHFPANCLLSPSLNLHLPQILLYIFQPSQPRSSPSFTSLRFTLKYFLNSPSLIHSYYMSSPFKYLLFNICYYV